MRHFRTLSARNFLKAKFKSLLLTSLDTCHTTCKGWVQTSSSGSFTLIAQKSWQFNEFTVFFLISFVCSPCVKSQGLPVATEYSDDSERGSEMSVTWTFSCSLVDESELVYTTIALRISIMQCKYLAIIFSNLKVITFIFAVSILKQIQILSPPIVINGINNVYPKILSIVNFED